MQLALFFRRVTVALCKFPPPFISLSLDVDRYLGVHRVCLEKKWTCILLSNWPTYLVRLAYITILQSSFSVFCSETIGLGLPVGLSVSVSAILFFFPIDSLALVALYTYSTLRLPHNAFEGETSVSTVGKNWDSL